MAAVFIPKRPSKLAIVKYDAAMLEWNGVISVPWAPVVLQYRSPNLDSIMAQLLITFPMAARKSIWSCSGICATSSPSDHVIIGGSLNMKKAKPETKEIKLHPDAWERFERAAKVVVKSPPQHLSSEEESGDHEEAGAKEKIYNFLVSVILAPASDGSW
jgi:hypothetical protein